MHAEVCGARKGPRHRAVTGSRTRPHRILPMKHQKCREEWISLKNHTARGRPRVHQQSGLWTLALSLLPCDENVHRNRLRPPTPEQSAFQTKGKWPRGLNIRACKPESRGRSQPACPRGSKLSLPLCPLPVLEPGGVTRGPQRGRGCLWTRGYL